MPHKVMIVDDEPIIRFGISSCVNWEQEGLTLLGEAANGEAALNMISDQAVDILITDIRMPVMDGLELTRKVKDFLPHIKVIFISSYSDFEFAREAVKLGVVVDYLLKPTMEPDDLVRILHKCKQLLDAEELRTQKEERLEREEHRHRMMQFESRLKSYLGGTAVHWDWKPDWLSKPLVIAIWRYDSLDIGTDEPSIVLLESVVDQLNSWCNQGISIVFSSNEIIVLLADHNGSANHAIASYQQRIILDDRLSFTVGISPSIHSYTSVRDALDWAVVALESSFFQGKGKCYQGIIPTKNDEILDTQEQHQQEKNRLRERFSRGFASTDRELCMGIFEEYVRQWKSGNYKRQDIILEARNLMMMMSRSHHFKHQTEDAMQSIMNKLATIEKATSLQSLVSFMNKELRRLWEPGQLLITAEDVGGAHTIQLALSYIQDHYRQEISLQEVADYAHMSKNYFSEQFKKRTGFNFIDFVIRLRIHYAKHLLETTSLRIVDIGLQSGFNSPKHFQKLFKRIAHATPGEYRDQLTKKQNNDDIDKEYEV